MGRKKTKNREPTGKRNTVVITTSSAFNEMIASSGYTSLDKMPEIVACVRKIAELIGSATIHLMSNTKNGDERIVNELSRLIDINPTPNMTRSAWMEWIVTTLLLHGKGNAIVQPQTRSGYLQRLEPIPAWRVSFMAEGEFDYKVYVDGIPRDPQGLLHFVYNPDKNYPWMGTGVNAPLKEIANNLHQARRTEKAFMSSEYKPSLIVKVDALTDELSTPSGRRQLLDDYVKPAEPGEPWIIPAEQFDVQQIKPLTLADLAISDTVTIDKRTIAAIMGVPAWIVGVGEYKRDEWNTFVQTKIMSIAKSIAAELTRKLITSPKWYLAFNVWSLMDYDLKTMSDVLLQGSDRGYINGDEWRDRMHMNPAGLTEYRVLENYIPWDMAGNQKKLLQNDE